MRNALYLHFYFHAQRMRCPYSSFRQKSRIEGVDYNEFIAAKPGRKNTGILRRIIGHAP